MAAFAGVDANPSATATNAPASKHRSVHAALIRSPSSHRRGVRIASDRHRLADAATQMQGQAADNGLPPSNALEDGHAVLLGPVWKRRGLEFGCLRPDSARRNPHKQSQ